MAEIKITTSPNGDVVMTISSSQAPPWAETLLATMQGLVDTKDTNTMALSKAVQDLVDRVAASTSLETSSAAALAELVNQSAQLHKQIDDLTAASGTLG